MRCYQDARFILVATPSGITLAPEGGAHQSVAEPLIGIGQPGLTGFEPAYADELAVLLRWALRRDPARGRRIGLFPAVDAAGRAAEAGRSTRRSPRRSSPAPIGCASRRPEPSWRSPIAARSPPRRSPPTRRSPRTCPGAGLLAVTSPDRLHRDWQAALAQRRGRARPSGCWRGCGRAPRWSPSATAIRRRCPGSARVARQCRGAARGRPVRPVGRHPGPLPRLWHRLRGDHRRRGPRLPPGAALAAPARRPQFSPRRRAAGAVAPSAGRSRQAW